MDITFACESCGQSIVIDEGGTGLRVECPKCGQPLTVPSNTQLGREDSEMINAHLYTSDILGLIESGLDPSEAGIAVCDFAEAGTGKPITAVLTNRHMRYMIFKRNWRGRNPLLVANEAVALRAISGISTAEAKPVFFGPKVFVLTFWWEGHSPGLVTTAIAAGKAFAGKLKEVVAEKDTSSGHTSIADEIHKLAQLANEGILSEDEWNRAKDHLIGTSPSQVDEAAKLLRQLHALLVQGVLSESEFNLKKWDVLSQRLIPRDRP
jgi:hypothetical protein